MTGPMTGLGRPAGTEVAIAVLAALTTFFTLLTWQTLSLASSDYLLPLFWFCAGIAASGLALRTLRTPWLLVPLVQLLGVGLVLNHWWSGLGPLGGWVPTTGSVREVVDVLGRAVEEAGSYPAPVPAEATEFYPVMVGAGCLLALGVDFLACTLRRVPVAGLPLLAGFTAPVSIVGGVSWLHFALAALMFVFLLTADQASRLGSWGRNLAGAGSGIVDDQPHQVRLGTLWPTSARIGLAGVGLAALVPAVLPAGGGLLDGTGGGGGDAVTISDPLVDMRRQLTRGSDIPLVRLRTDDPAPSYLRTSVLDEFDGTTWSASERDLPPSNRVTGAMPAAPGLSEGTPRVERRTSLSITEELDSTWLPTPYPATVVDVPGDWRYSNETLDLISIDGDTRGLEYDVVGLELDPDVEQLASAPPPPRLLLAEGTALPSTMPQWIEDLADEVTSEARSPFERAVQLQDWFRVDGGFDYSLSRGSGSGIEQLERFLGTGEGSRVGYCEQFASAMAMMARSIGIPARVAVGFLRAESAGDDSWVYSSYDLHSWPELYFEGAGWIRFEPTPQARTAQAVPAYTVGRIPDPEAAPSASASVSPGELEPTRSISEGAASGDTTTESPAVARRVGVTLAVVLLLLGVLLAPRVVRGWVRRLRFAEGDPREVAEGAWGEVRATALDLRRSWSDGTTTRQQARRLVPAMGGQPLAPLESLALLVERSRYSRTGLTAAECDLARELAGQVTQTMVASAEATARRRATWLPRSLWRRRDVRRRQVTRSSAVSQGTELEKVSL